MSQEHSPTADDRSPGRASADAQEWFIGLYHELQRMARGELFRHQALTMGPHTLLHEVWLRFDSINVEFASQQELARYAARMMRGIVIDYIRARKSLKRGGEYKFEPYETLEDLRTVSDDEAIGIAEALDTLATVDPDLTELVELRFFAGLTFGEIAALRSVSERTVQRDWEKARTLLFSTIRS